MELEFCEMCGKEVACFETGDFFKETKTGHGFWLCDMCIEKENMYSR